MSMNPLLDFSGLPRFADIRPEHVAPAIDQLLSENQALIDRLGADAQSPTWENFVAPLDDANERLARAWGQVAHLNAVMNTAQLREVYNATLPKISQYFAGLSQNEQLYARYKALHGAPGFAALSREQKKIVENELRDFRLGGAELEPHAKTEFKQLREQLDRLSSRFNDNVLCNERLHLDRAQCRRAEGCATRRGRGRSGRGTRRWRRRLEADLAYALLSSGDAICG